MLILLLIVIFIIILNTQVNISNNSKWSKKELILLENNSKSYRQNIIIDSNNTLHLSWKGKTYLKNLFNIYYKDKEENQNWTDVQLISQEEHIESHCLSMDVDENNTIHIAWLDETEYLNSGIDKDIFYRYKPINQNWSEIELISKESINDCNCPSMSIKNEHLAVYLHLLV